MIIGYRKSIRTGFEYYPNLNYFYFKHISDIKKSIFVRLYILGGKGKPSFESPKLFTGYFHHRKLYN